MRRSHSVAAFGLGALLGLVPTAAPAATEVVFLDGAYLRSIPVADLEHLAATGETRGLLRELVDAGRQKPEQVAQLLNVAIPLPLVPTSRLLNSTAGKAILGRVALILFPLRAPTEALPALRAATINGLVSGKGSLTTIGFLRAFPNRDMAVSLPALQAAMHEVEAMGGIVKGFLTSDIKSNVKSGSR